MIREARFFGKPIKRIVGTEKGIAELGEAGEETTVVSDDVFSYISDEVTPQGVLAVLEEEFKAAASPRGNCVLLDGIRDPGNMGTIIRTCAAAGVTDIYLIDCCDPYSPKAVRASMSGIYRVSLYVLSRESAADVLKDIPVITADMSGKDVFSSVAPERFCLAIGSEAQGLSEEIRKLAAFSVAIPMKNGIESLNAGVSLAVILYLFTNKNR